MFVHFHGSGFMVLGLEAMTMSAANWPKARAAL